MPVAVVQELAVIFYKDLGIANESITRWTSLIALPWSLQMLLGPLVDLNFTKRWWIQAMQLGIGACLVVLAFAMRMPQAFEFSLMILAGTAMMSALCNTAMDGFAITAMDRTEQAQFAGIMSTFYRLGRLFCIAFLVLIAGLLMKGPGGMEPRAAWSTVLLIGGGVYVVSLIAARVLMPKPEADAPRNEDKREVGASIGRTALLIALGLSGYFFLNAVVRLVAHGIWAANGADPEGQWKGWMIAEANKIPVLGGASPTGISAELFQLVICAVLVVLSAIGARKMIKGSETGVALGSFAQQSGFAWILFFIVFYRFPEAMVGKITPLFLKDAVDKGGLALPNEQIGVISSFVGVVGIIIGGIAGGWLVSKIGLRKAFWPLALAMHVPNLLYLWAASGTMPMSVIPLSWPGPLNLTVGLITFVDQMGYGFGFAAYMVYLMWVAQRGNYRTAHYAIGTGLGALCIQGAGILSGVVQSNFGYTGVFIAVMIGSIPGLISILKIPLDESHKEIRVEVE